MSKNKASGCETLKLVPAGASSIARMAELSLEIESASLAIRIRISFSIYETIIGKQKQLRLHIPINLCNLLGAQPGVPQAALGPLGVSWASWPVLVSNSPKDSPNICQKWLVIQLSCNFFLIYLSQGALVTESSGSRLRCAPVPASTDTATASAFLFCYRYCYCYCHCYCDCSCY